MHSLIQQVEAKFKKPKIVDVRSGDTVRVYQKIKEGSKERIQMFEGLVIKTNKLSSVSASILVRRVASGVGVEKSFLLHSPLVEKVEVVKRSKVRRNYLSYMRNRSGKSARMSGVDFDKEKVNDVFVPEDKSKAAKEAEAALAEEPKADPQATEKEPDTADSKPEEANKDDRNLSMDAAPQPQVENDTAMPADEASNK